MKPLLITAGEPAGIGTDCILRAWQHAPELFAHCVIAAPALWLRERALLIGIDISIDESADLDCIDCSDTSRLHCWYPLTGNIAISPVTPASPSPATAAAVIGCIEAAALACLNGSAAALITGPIEKAVLRTSGFLFPGHTEFLAHLARERVALAGNQMDHVMMLASDQLRVALLTTHIAISDVPAALSIDATLDCMKIVDHDLRKRFAIKEPHIGLCGLNPHAGEQGHFGREEIDILAPAAAQAIEAGIRVTGPLPADTLFSAPQRRHYDAIVCCYHDQALIPLKTLSFGDAVNITLGLPFIRTSVDHGTALDRVGSDSVSYTSMVMAIRMAITMVTLEG
ncbi:MAG: 4-hydroxythreonine-4-phosphate dehydrogenase PdxA [Zetaproteobacteria bacterium CG12_big_fil_rev_8_21_14_0_65_54_13]|nr:MAG: 4-hydroxythreonine-4-phosphate dehydrogenase PdxA [Zetaproteobacteria bacterium CG23_combo_of_CG06-09_8_20_14_all_54_7]PIW50710.1 MAG: 4-hydroxythreonine-4-phosphate dehydrogenase PdxA [Zetaproteobacteria bacterium CG12_big_fil_rev_8_21_14_0_65_54_13]PIX55591.1 MAG: 4-hydroxythreonine-4-phosphate dehydrogenase PdxA [Zetaproteobacteria bacterium CG_4_10_14_3_um_filter_54_28]PJA27463.1 MAG: 4-hydroxythreonine-4-phosphate dehydrogenase PdxA [Zetaproteobacteria bacterium CG_4_9_14_3_um_filte